MHATLAVARLIRENHPKLFNFALTSKTKERCRELLDLRQPKPLLHVSGKIPARFHHLAMVVPLVKHPGNSNGVIVFNLHYSPDDLLQLSKKGDQGIEEIRKRLFTRNDDLLEGVKRLPLKTIHLNRTPVVVPVNVLKEEDAERLQIDTKRCQNNFQELQNLSKEDKLRLDSAVTSAMDGQQFSTAVNDDAGLYGGGFTAESDNILFEKIRNADPGTLASFNEKNFKDPRAKSRLLRYRARNFPDTLSEKDKASWLVHCRQQLSSLGTGEHKATFNRSIESYREKLLPEHWQSATGKPENEELRLSLTRYADDLEKRLNLNAEIGT